MRSGLGFFGGSVSGGTNCLSAPRGRGPRDAGVTSCFPPPPPPPERPCFSTGVKTTSAGVYKTTAVSLSFGCSVCGATHGTSASPTMETCSAIESRRGALVRLVNQLGVSERHVAAANRFGWDGFFSACLNMEPPVYPHLVPV